MLFWMCVWFGCVVCRCCVSSVVCRGGCSECVIMFLMCVFFIFFGVYVFSLVMCDSILLCVFCVVFGWWFGCSWFGVCGSIVSSVVLVCDSCVVGLFR